MVAVAVRAQVWYIILFRFYSRSRRFFMGKLFFFEDDALGHLVIRSLCLCTVPITTIQRIFPSRLLCCISELIRANLLSFASVTESYHLGKLFFNCRIKKKFYWILSFLIPKTRQQMFVAGKYGTWWRFTRNSLVKFVHARVEAPPQTFIHNLKCLIGIFLPYYVQQLRR